MPACMSLPPGPYTEEDQFHSMFDTNVLGLILATQEAVKQFGPEGGSVINIGSVVSRMTPPTSVIYSATKGAVDAVCTRAGEIGGPGKILVSSINPGGVETEGFHRLGFAGSDFEKQMIAQTPLGRTGQPGGIAPIAVCPGLRGLCLDDEARLCPSGGMR